MRLEIIGEYGMFFPKTRHLSYRALAPPLNPGYNPQKRMRCVAHLHLGSKSAAQKAAQRLIELEDFLGDMIRRQTELAA